MLNRLWFLVSLFWAACVILPDLGRLSGKILMTGLAPFLLGAALRVSVRYVRFGKLA